MSTSTVINACERHVFYDVPCSGDTKFILKRHGKAHPICTSLAKHIWTVQRGLCFECRKPMYTHWITEPIK